MTSLQIDNAWEIYRALNTKTANAWFNDKLWAYAVRCAFAGGTAVTMRIAAKSPPHASVPRMAGIRKP